MRLALRNTQAPRAEAVLAEVVHTVDLVLHSAIVRRTGSTRMRRLVSLSCVAGVDGGQPVLQELMSLGSDGRLHRVGSPAAMPERVWSKLAQVCDPSRLLDGFDD